MIALLASALAGPVGAIDMPGLCLAIQPGQPGKKCPGIDGTRKAMPGGDVLVAGSVPEGPGQAVLFVMSVPKPPVDEVDRFRVTLDLLGGFVNSFGAGATGLNDLPTRGVKARKARWDDTTLAGVPASRFVWERPGIVMHGALLFTTDGLIFVQALSAADSDTAQRMLDASVAALTVKPLTSVPGRSAVPLDTRCLPDGVQGDRRVGPKARRYSYGAVPGTLATGLPEGLVRYRSGDQRISISVDPEGYGFDANAPAPGDLDRLTNGLRDYFAESGVVDVQVALDKSGSCKRVTVSGMAEGRHLVVLSVLDGSASVQVECVSPDVGILRTCSAVADSIRRIP